MGAEFSAPVTIGSAVLVKLDDGWIVGRCLALTPKVALVEIDCVQSASQTRRNGIRLNPVEIDHASLSDSQDWPPQVPDGFPLSVHHRGYMGRIMGETRWICGKRSPREAYLIYHAAFKAAETPEASVGYAPGDHVAFAWGQVFVPVPFPVEALAPLAVKHTTQWAYAPTTEAPAGIRHFKHLKPWTPAVDPCLCVYFLCLSGHIVYVGQTRNIHNRLEKHKGHKRFDAVFFMICPRLKVTKIERRLIRRFRPVYNENGKGPQSLSAQFSAAALDASPSPSTAVAGGGEGGKC